MKRHIAAALVLFLCFLSWSPSKASEEKDVDPGINANFLNPNLNVRQWVERFEHEGREVYDHRREIVAKAKIQPGWDVADIGAGTGLFEPLLARAAGANATVYAVDIAKGFLKYIDQRAAKLGLHNVKTVLCTEHSVKLPENSINLAFICDVYHHFEYPQDSLASIYRALRPGGYLVLVDFKRIPGKSSPWILHHMRAGQKVFEREIEQAGFKKVEELGFLKQSYMVRFRTKKAPSP